MRRLFSVFLVLFTVYLMGCSDFWNEKIQNVQASEGNVVIRLNSGDRTVSPVLPQDISASSVKNWEVAFYKDGNDTKYTLEDTTITLSESKNYTLPAGVYKITIDGSCDVANQTTGGTTTYYYHGEANNVVVGTDSISVNIVVGLKKTGSGTGKLNCTLIINNMSSAIRYSVDFKGEQYSYKDYFLTQTDSGLRYFDCTPDASSIGTISKNVESLPSGYYSLVIKYGDSSNEICDTYIPFDLGDNLIEIADGLTTEYTATITMPDINTERTYYVSSDGEAEKSGLLKSYPTTFANAVEKILAYKKSTQKNTGYCIAFLCDGNESVLTVPDIDVLKFNDILKANISFSANAIDKNDTNASLLSLFNVEPSENATGQLSWNVGSNENKKYNLSFTGDGDLEVYGLNFSNIASIGLTSRARLIAYNAKGTTKEDTNNLMVPVPVKVDDANNYSLEKPFLKYSVDLTLTTNVFFGYTLASAKDPYSYTEKQDFYEEKIIPETGESQSYTITYVRCYPETTSTKPKNNSKTMLWNDSATAYLTDDYSNIGDPFFSSTTQNLRSLYAWSFDNSGNLYYLANKEGSQDGKCIYSAQDTNVEIALPDTVGSNVSLTVSDTVIYVLDHSSLCIYAYDKDSTATEPTKIYLPISSNAVVTAVYAHGSTLYTAVKEGSTTIKIFKIKPVVIARYDENEGAFTYENSSFPADSIDVSPSAIYGENQPSSNNYKVADLQVVENSLYALICDTYGFKPDNSNWQCFYSRGALVKINASDIPIDSNCIFGLYTDSSFTSDTTLVVQNADTLGTNFIGPRRFIARKPDELVIADDGAVKEDDAYSLKDRVVVFDLSGKTLSAEDAPEDIKFNVSNLVVACAFGE